MIGGTQDSNCPYLVFEGTWQQFLRGKSQTFRKNLKTAARRLKRERRAALSDLERGAGGLGPAGDLPGDRGAQLEGG